MRTALFIARRYFFSFKTRSAINIISGISAVGVCVATIALVCTMSVFNGFQDLIASLFTAFDPQLRVTLVEGRTLPSDDPALQRLRQYDGIEVYTQTLEDLALIVRDGKQVVVTVKGVDDNFSQQADLAQLLYGTGQFCLHVDVLEYGIMGIQLASGLGLAMDDPNPIVLYAPKRGERVNIANPMASFNQEEFLMPGHVFMVKQAKYDAHYILTSLGLAQRLFDQRDRVSAIELKLKPGVSTARAKREVQALLGERFRVQDRYEQQDDVFRIMRIEKLIAYLFLTFIILVACFNIVGSLSMLMIDKRNDVVTLRNLGASEALVRRIFTLEGVFVSMLGALLGIVVGLVLCWLQTTFGLISMGGKAGSFIVESYPVSVHAMDILLIFITVLLVSVIATWYPVRYLSKNLLS